MQVSKWGWCLGERRNREESCRYGKKGNGKVEKIMRLVKEREVKERRKGVGK